MTPQELIEAAHKIAWLLETHPGATPEMMEEAIYLRAGYGFAHDIRPGGNIGPRSATAYLRVQLNRWTKLTRLDEERA